MLLDGPTSVDTGADRGPAGTGPGRRDRRPSPGLRPHPGRRPPPGRPPERARLRPDDHGRPGPPVRDRLGLRRLRRRAPDPADGAVRCRARCPSSSGWRWPSSLALVRGETAMLPADIVWSVLAGLAGGIGISGLYHGLAVGRMGVVAPITAVLAALIPVGGRHPAPGRPRAAGRRRDRPGHRRGRARLPGRRRSRRRTAVRAPVRAHRRRRHRVVQRLRRPAQRRSCVRPAHAHPRHGGGAHRSSSSS